MALALVAQMAGRHGGGRTDYELIKSLKNFREENMSGSLAALNHIG